ncbi:hypothetical protein LguiA_023064 [Lonicera macranthoides]
MEANSPRPFGFHPILATSKRERFQLLQSTGGATACRTNLECIFQVFRLPSRGGNLTLKNGAVDKNNTLYHQDEVIWSWQESKYIYSINKMTRLLRSIFIFLEPIRGLGTCGKPNPLEGRGSCKSTSLSA